MAIISDRIFDLIRERGMTQKEFSIRTKIAESTISDWKRRRVNPVSDKIMIICEVLDVSPEELLSGAKPAGHKSWTPDRVVVSLTSEEGQLLDLYDRMDSRMKARLIGYAMALEEANREG